jgi:Zn-dependent M32 family carboxypeptidase
MGEAYVELMSRMKEIETVGQIQGLLGWDQEVMMPPKAAPLRAEQLAWLSRTSHAMMTESAMGESLAAAEAEGHLVVYYQHGKEQKLLDLRHSDLVEVASYNHSSLKHSHACVDVIQAKGTASNLRLVIEQLQNTPDVDKVSFITAPMREEGCC